MRRAPHWPPQRSPLVACLTVVCLAGSAVWSGQALAADSFGSLDADVHVRGMTFVGSRDNVEEFVVRAARGVLVPGTRVAHLEEVDIASADGPGGQNFSVRCDRGELNVETSDFLAEGHVEGQIADGRRYSAPWVRYDHAKSLLFTDAPVVMQDATGTFRGDGFRYFVSEQRFRLLGNVSLVQTP